MENKNNLEEMEKSKTELLNQLKEMNISADNLDWVNEQLDQTIDEEVKRQIKQQKVMNSEIIKKIKNECSSLQLNMSDEQINELIKISKEDLIESKGTFDEDTHYQLSLSNVKLTWVRFIRQYSNNPLNEIIDVDKIINDEKLKVKTLLK